MEKPQNFFIGIIDFFAIILPGGVGSLILYYQLNTKISHTLFTSESHYLIAFLFSSYFLGHIIFMLSSYLDIIADKLILSTKIPSNELAYRKAKEIKYSFLPEVSELELNTYKWSTSLLTTHFPEAMIEIDRVISDSKFFRSFILIIPCIVVVFLSNNEFTFALCTAIILIPCILRYYDRRIESNTRAYQYVIMLHGFGKLNPLFKSSQLVFSQQNVSQGQ